MSTKKPLCGERTSNNGVSTMQRIAADGTPVSFSFMIEVKSSIVIDEKPVTRRVQAMACLALAGHQIIPVTSAYELNRDHYAYDCEDILRNRGTGISALDIRSLRAAGFFDVRDKAEAVASTPHLDFMVDTVRPQVLGCMGTPNHITIGDGSWVMVCNAVLADKTPGLREFTAFLGRMRTPKGYELDRDIIGAEVHKPDKAVMG